MTIALGMLAHDGIVFAADSQITAGDWKYKQGKLLESWRTAGPWGDAGSLVFTGAGDVGALELAWEFIRRSADYDLTIGDQLIKFRETFEEFHTRHILPFHVYQPWERPGVDLIIGCARGRELVMWRSHINTLVEVHLFKAVGTGGPLVESVLGRLVRLPFLTMAQSSILAAYLVRLAKDNDAGSSGRTSITFIRNDGLARPLGRETCRRLDDLAEQYAYELEPILLRRIVGAEGGDFDSALALMNPVSSKLLDAVELEIWPT